MKQWVIKQPTNSMPDLPEYPAFILKLLSLRNKSSEKEISEFLNPDFGKLHSPFLFKDMEKCVDRIELAINQKEKIFIYADYDADAITAASVLFLAIKKLGGVIDCYIPDRFTEGYGLNIEALEKIKEKAAQLVITVDCGTNAVDEAEHCKQLGMDLIITDHHEITGGLPQAYALINPKNEQDNYPFPFLTGVGVAYKLVQSLMSRITAGWEKWLLDLVALGTVADCQSLSGENRILVSFGLKVLAKTRWLGLQALVTAAGISGKKFDTFTLGFLLAPRINAAGRIKHADVAFKLLTCENMEEAKNYALELNGLNSHRQLLTAQILSEAKSQVERIRDKKVLMASGSDWPKGVVGLVAGRLAEEYARPVLVMERGEVFATGSARSVANFDMIAALKFASSLLSKYGGHTQAAGFTLQSQNVEALHQKLLEYAESVNFETGNPQLLIDLEVASSDLNWESFGYLEKFGPFGVGNPKPRLLGKNFELLGFRLVGNGSKHLKMTLGFDQQRLPAIAFGQGFLANSLKVGQKLDAVFELESNEWNGQESLQMKIIDLKPSEQ